MLRQQAQGRLSTSDGDESGNHARSSNRTFTVSVPRRRSVSARRVSVEQGALLFGGRLRSLVALSLATLACVSSAGAATLPQSVFDAVHGRIDGWASTPGGWFVVYVDRAGADWCGLGGASWWMALVETKKLPVRVSVSKRISGAMCGNELAWVRTGRFIDGRHEEVAFMLWTDPAIGATTFIYRIGGGRFSLLAKFGGDRVVLGRGTVTVSFENRGRSAHGEIEDVYRWRDGHYRLTSRR